MTFSLWQVSVGIVLLAINIAIYLGSYGRKCELATGARMFAVLGFGAFVVASYAVGNLAMQAYVFPRERWPDMVLELSGTLLIGATLGGSWMWWISGDD